MNHPVGERVGALLPPSVNSIHVEVIVCGQPVKGRTADADIVEGGGKGSVSFSL